MLLKYMALADLLSMILKKNSEKLKKFNMYGCHQREDNEGWEGSSS